MSDVPTVIYLTGWGRSGSTVLNRLLVGDQVVGVGELRLLWLRGVVKRQDCSCGNPWDRCELWRPVVKAVLGERAVSDQDAIATATEWHELGKRAGRAVALRPRNLDGAARRYAALLGDVYRSIADHTGAKVIIDSSKDPAHALLARASGADVSVVHLVRDPRGVVWSHQRVKAPPPGAKANTTEPQSPLYIATRWTLRNAFIDRAVESDLRIRYEDMVADTEQTSRDIFATAGVDAPLEPGGAEHLIAGNPNRFAARRATVLDDEWRKAQPAGQRRLIELVAGRVMRRYGYE